MFYEVWANPLATPMIGRSKTNDNPYHPCEEEKIVNKSKSLTAVLRSLT